MPVSATGRQVGISPKRVRPLLRALQGRPVQAVLNELRFQPGRRQKKCCRS